MLPRDDRSGNEDEEVAVQRMARPEPVDRDVLPPVARIADRAGDVPWGGRDVRRRAEVRGRVHAPPGPVPMNKTYCTESAGAVVLTFASASPPCTTWFHNSAITNPKAVVKEAAIVFRTSAAESFRSSAMVNPEPGWTTEFLGFTVTAPGSLSPLSRHGHPQSARLDTAPSNPSRGASPCPRP